MHACHLTIVLILLCNTALPSATVASVADDLDIALAEIEARYHVKVHYRYKPVEFFPKKWMTPSLRLSAAPIHIKDATALIPALEQFLSTHPIAVVQGNLEHIYLLGKLSFKGKRYGGTHSGKSIYVVWDHSRKCTTEFALDRFHSEFSSILHDYHAFPRESWAQINPSGFHYTGTGFEMLGDDDIYAPSDQDQSNGFLLKYSKSSMENDFNMISVWLFTKPEDLESLAQQHSRIRQKTILAEEFYSSLSDQYTFR